MTGTGSSDSEYKQDEIKEAQGDKQINSHSY